MTFTKTKTNTPKVQCSSCKAGRTLPNVDEFLIDEEISCDTCKREWRVEISVTISGRIKYLRCIKAPIDGFL